MSIFDKVKSREGTAFAISGRSYTPRSAREIVLDNLTEDALDAKMECEKGHMFRFKNGQALFTLKYGSKLIAVKQTGLEHNVVQSRDDLCELIDAVSHDVNAGLYDQELERLQRQQRERMATIRAAWNALSPQERAARRAASSAKAANVTARGEGA